MKLSAKKSALLNKKNNCYHALVLKDHWRVAMDVLSDLVNNMQLVRDDFQLEKSVILQEIAMGDDALEELVYDIYLENCLPKHPLGRPILGTEASVSAMTQKQINHFYKQNYSGKNLIVAAAGNIDHEELVKAVEHFLGSKPKKKLKINRTRPKHRPFKVVMEKPSEQLHLLLGLPCATFKDKNRFEAFVVNALLGGGMTSKLYQSVREKRGLVYTIYSTLNTFDDFGILNIYASCEKDKMKAVVKTVASELKKLSKRKITAHELEMFKTQVKGGLLLGSDDIENRMQSIGVNEMVFGNYKPVTSIIEEMDAITVKSVNDYLKNNFDLKNMGAVLVGGGASELKEWFQDFKFA
jgi:predicted Zn-dependent peptidase